MQFFKSYKAFNGINEKLSLSQATDKLDGIEAELKNDAPDFGKVLRKMNRVIGKSEEDVTKNSDVNTRIATIYKTFMEKVEKSSDKDALLKKERYEVFKNYVEAYEKGENEKAQEIAKQGAEIIAKEEKEKADKENADKEALANKDAESSKAIAEVDAEKFKNLFKNTKINQNTAPQLSKSLAKNEVPEVKALQQFLMDKGYLQTSEASAADGYFGDKTAAAVMAYQKDKGLTQDGIVGINTWKEILKDVKLEPAKDFKAVQLNATAPATKDVKKPNSQQDIDNAKKKLNSSGVTTESVKPKTIDKIAETLAAERMTAFGVDSDEDLIYNELMGQLANGVINTTTLPTLMSKYKLWNDEYKDERKNGLFSDLMYVFDTDAGKVNGMLQKQFEAIQAADPNFVKVKQSIFQDAGSAIVNSPATKYVLLPALTMYMLPVDLIKGASEETVRCTTLFIALGACKAAVANDEFKRLKINLDLINKIITASNPAAAEEAKKEETKSTTTAKPAATAKKPEVKK